MSNVTPIQISLMEWFNKEMEASGLSTERVAHAGIAIHLGSKPGPASPGFSIPYYDPSGAPIHGYTRYRLREPEANADDEWQYGRRDKFSKYWQPKNLPQLLYWPRVLGVDHTVNLANASCPLFICEGERKALKLQIELMSLGVEASVVAVPGAKISKDLLVEFGRIVWRVESGGRTVPRTTFLVFDFNDKGKAEEETREGENKLRAHLRGLGADIVPLRWEAGASVAKVDDWLVAGGDLKAAITSSIDRKADSEDELYMMLTNLNQHFAMLNGEFVRIDGPNKGTVLKTTQFHNEHGHLFVEQFVGKKILKVHASREWIDWADKRCMDGFCFQPPALGQPLEPWVGGRLNIAQPWVDCDLPPWGAEDLPVMLIDKLLNNFCESPKHFQWLRQHIAHALLFPNVMTSQVVLLCGAPGTGKTMLMDSLRRLAHPKLLGGLAKSVSLDRQDDFNAALEGTVIALYEEPLRKSGKDIESIIKRISGTQTIEIRRMRTDTYQVPNYIHLFVAMNLRYLSHIGKDDRRCNFFEGKERIGLDGNGFAVEYDQFMNSAEFAPTWLKWAIGVPLDGYSPQVLGPISRARTVAIGFSSTAEEDFFSSEEVTACAVRDMTQLQQMWGMQGYKPISDRMMSRLAEANGWTESRAVKVGGASLRLRALGESWLDRPSTDWAEEYQRGKQNKY